MKTVGMIGGMGPEATLDLFQKIISNTPASRDQEHLHVLIDNCPQVPDRTTFLLGDGDSPLPHLLKSAQNLVQIGASALCMPCNTAHYFVEEIRRNVSVPFISIIDCAVEEITSTYPQAQKIGLLATRGTMEARIYHNAFEQQGLEIVSLSEAFQAQIMEVIYGVKAGKLKEKLPDFRICLEQMKQLGAEVLIAGCTEIPLLLPYVESPMPIIDPTLSLAKTVVRFGRET